MCVLWRGLPATRPETEPAVLLPTPVPAGAETGLAESQACERPGLSGESTPGAATLGSPPPRVLARVAREAFELQRVQSPAPRRTQCPAA